MDYELREKQMQKRLRSARLQAGFKQKDVEQRTGIHRTTLGGYENGVSKPHMFVLADLAELYGVSTDWLITGKGNARVSELEEKL